MSQKKVFTRYVIVENNNNNNIYISDIIISIIYTTLITLGSEICRGRKSVRSFFFIGKTNERTKETRETSETERPREDAISYCLRPPFGLMVSKIIADMCPLLL